MDILYFTYPLSALIIFTMALGLGIFLTRKFHLSWRLYWIGAATFILSQVGHIPFNHFLTLLFQQGILPAPPVGWKLLFNAVVLGLSAGLWEELSRYAMYRWWVKDARSWRKALLLGAGHGGIEALAVGALILYTYIQMVALRGADLSKIVPAGQIALAQQQIAAYWSSPWTLSMLGALERAFTIPSQVAFSVLILQAFTRQQSRWIWMAVGWHAFIDAVAVYAIGIWGPYITEALIGLMASISIGLIFALRQPEPAEPEPSIAQPMPVQTFQLPEIEESLDNLENTRYN